MNWAVLVPIIVAIVAASPGIVALIRDYRKVRVEEIKIGGDAAKSITEAAASVVAMMKAEIGDLRKRIEMLEGIVQALEKQLEALGHLPVSKE